MGQAEPESVETATRISQEIAGIHRESYGEEVQSVTTHVHDDSVVCILDITLLPHEQTLLDKDAGTTPSACSAGSIRRPSRRPSPRPWST
jgi:uncharacterized protein YbcI